jgi:hypothetical protein
MPPVRLALCYLTAVSLATFLSAVSHAQRYRGNWETVEGKLKDYGPRGVQIESESGGVTNIEVGPQTIVQVRAPGSQELLQEGNLVEVYGTARAPSVVEDAQLTVFLGGRQVTSRFGKTYIAEAESPDSIPVVLIAQVVKTDPLLVKASNSVASEYYFTNEKGADGRPLRSHLFPTVNKVFEVHPAIDREGSPRVFADLGDAMQFASPGDRVRATISEDGGAARQVSIFRDQPLSEEEMSPKQKKPSKSRRSGKKSKADEKSKPDSKDEQN